MARPCSSLVVSLLTLCLHRRGYWVPALECLVYREACETDAEGEPLQIDVFQLTHNAVRDGSFRDDQWVCYASSNGEPAV